MVVIHTCPPLAGVAKNFTTIYDSFLGEDLIKLKGANMQGHVEIELEGSVARPLYHRFLAEELDPLGFKHNGSNYFRDKNGNGREFKIHGWLPTTKLEEFIARYLATLQKQAQIIWQIIRHHGNLYSLEQRISLRQLQRDRANQLRRLRRYIRHFA